MLSKKEAQAAAEALLQQGRHERDRGSPLLARYLTENGAPMSLPYLTNGSVP